MKRIDEVYLFVADNYGPGEVPGGEEGVVAAILKLPELDVYSPYFTTKRAHVENFRTHAQQVADLGQKQIRILRISGSVEVIDVIEPQLPPITNQPPEGVQ